MFLRKRVRRQPRENVRGFDPCSPGAEPVFEDFAGEFLDGLALSLGGLPQGQERLFVHFDFEMAPLDIRVNSSLDGTLESSLSWLPYCSRMGVTEPWPRR